MTQCLIISAKDNVAVAAVQLKKGDLATCLYNGELICQIAAVTDVPIYHKTAIRPIEEGAPVIKYGCVIGVAAKSIEAARTSIAIIP